MPRVNGNDARVKRWKPRTVPASAALFSLYADYLDEEYSDLDSTLCSSTCGVSPAVPR